MASRFGRRSVFHLPHQSERFKDGFWNGPFKEGPHQDDVKWTEQHWDNQSPDGITQLQELSGHNVARTNPALKSILRSENTVKNLRYLKVLREIA